MDGHRRHVLLMCKTCKICKDINDSYTIADSGDDTKIMKNDLLINYISAFAPSGISRVDVTLIEFSNYLTNKISSCIELDLDLNNKIILSSKELQTHPHPLAFKPYVIRFPILLSIEEQEWKLHSTSKPGISYPGSPHLHALVKGYTTKVALKSENKTNYYELLPKISESENRKEGEKVETKKRFIVPSKFKFLSIVTQF